MFYLLISMGLAVAPCMALGVFIYWRDKFDREPLHLLIFSFLLGALSALPAAISGLILDEIFGGYLSGLWGNFLLAFIFVAVFEEGWKFVFVDAFAYRKKAFNEPYDGITYAVMVSLGFATLENILYTLQGGMNVPFLRMFTAVPAHVTFGVIMGYFMGLAKFKNNSTGLKFLGLFGAIFMHGFYNFSLFSAEQIPLMVIGALLSLIIGVALSLRAIHLHRKNSPFNPAVKSENYVN
jgi:RsiW-degrading membrane proteinase PrsW (M82 family)